MVHTHISGDTMRHRKGISPSQPSTVRKVPICGCAIKKHMRNQLSINALKHDIQEVCLIPTIQCSYKGEGEVDEKSSTQEAILRQKATGFKFKQCVIVPAHNFHVVTKNQRPQKYSCNSVFASKKDSTVLSTKRLRTCDQEHNLEFNHLTCSPAYLRGCTGRIPPKTSICLS